MNQLITRLSDYLYDHYGKGRIDKKDWKIEKTPYNYGDQYSIGYNSSEFRDPKQLYFNLGLDGTIARIWLALSYKSVFNAEAIRKQFNNEFPKKLAELAEGTHTELIIYETDYKRRGMKYCYYPVGPNSKRVIGLLQPLIDSIYPSSNGLILNNGYHNYPYKLVPTDKGNLEVVVGNNYSKFTISTKEELDHFYQSLAKDKKLIDETEDSIISIVQEVDITAYYDRNKQALFIYNQYVPFHLKKIYENGKFKYRARFNTGYNRNIHLEKLVEKLKEKARKYIKQNRVKAATTGRGQDVMKKFYFRLTNNHKNHVNFKQDFISNLSEGELNTRLQTNINKNVIELDKPFIDYYQQFIRTKKRRHQLKSGYKIGDIYAFIAGTKIFVLTEDEWSNLTLSGHKWNTKKDREKAEKLEAWKSEKKEVIAS